MSLPEIRPTEQAQFNGLCAQVPIDGQCQSLNLPCLAYDTFLGKPYTRVPNLGSVTKQSL